MAFNLLRQEDEGKSSRPYGEIQKALSLDFSRYKKPDDFKSQLSSQLVKPLTAALSTLSNSEEKESDLKITISVLLAKIEMAEKLKFSEFKEEVLLAKAFAQAKCESILKSAGAGSQAVQTRISELETGQQISTDSREQVFFKESIAKVASDLASGLSTNSTSPTSNYGFRYGDNEPVWAATMPSRYSNALQNSEKEDAEGLRDFRAAMRSRLEGKPGLYENLELDKINSTDKISSAISQLTYVQKAIDGISLAIKAGFLGGQTSEEELGHFFPRALYSSKDFNQILMLAGILKPTADFDASNAADMVIGRLIARAKKANIGEGFTNLAVASNFGEGAGTLNPIITALGKTPVQGDAIENLRQFYKVLLDSNRGLVSSQHQKAWKKLDKTLTGRLLNDTHYLQGGDQTLAVKRNTYDVSLAASFVVASQQKEGAYYTSALFRSHAGQFLDIIGGVGANPLPASVPLSIVNSTSMVNFFYERFGSNEAGFLDIMTRAATRLSGIFSRPLDATFNQENFGTVATNVEAANILLAQSTLPKGNAVLDDMVARFLDTSFVEENNIIKLKNPYALVLLARQQEDFNNIQEFMRQMNVQTSDYWNVGDKYRKIIDAKRQLPPGISMLRLQKSSYYLLQKLPQTYLYGFDETYDRLVATNVLKFTRVSGAGDFDQNVWKTSVDKVSGAQGLKKEFERANIGSTGQTTTGHISTNYRSDVNRYSSDVTTGQMSSDNIFRQSTTQAQNFYAGVAEINELFLDWLESKGTSRNLYLQDVDNITDERYRNELKAQLRAIGQGAGLQLFARRVFDDSGNYTLQLEAIVNDGTKYLRLANLDKYQGELNDLLGEKVEMHQKYAEVAQWHGFGTNIGTYTAYEQQRRDISMDGSQVEPPERFGLAIGAGNILGDKRLASLQVKTASGSMASLYSYSPNFESAGEMRAAVVSAGYLFFRDDETDLRGRPIGQLQSMSRTEFVTGKPAYMLSTQNLVDGLYGLAMGGKDFAGGMAATQNWGLGAIMNYGGSARSYMVNGQYFSTGISTNVFAEQNENTGATVNTVVETPLKLPILGDVNLVFYGLSADDKTRLRNQLNKTARGQELLTRMEDKTSEIADALEASRTMPGSKTGPYFWNDPDQRNEKMQQWTSDIIGFLEEARRLLPVESLTNTKNQFSIGIEKPGEYETKIAISRVGTLSSDLDSPSIDGDAYYAVNMTRTTLGDNNTASFIAAVPVGYSEEKAKESSVKNFGGVRLDVGNFALGVTGYNLGTAEPTSTKMDVWYVKGDFAAKLSGTILGEGGHAEEFVIGDRRIQGSIETTNAKRISSQAAAISYFVAAEHAIGANIRRTTAAGEMNVLELGVNYRYVDDGRTLGLEIGHVKSWVGDDATNKDWRIRLNFSLPIR